MEKYTWPHYGFLIFKFHPRSEKAMLRDLCYLLLHVRRANCLFLRSVGLTTFSNYGLVKLSGKKNSQDILTGGEVCIASWDQVHSNLLFQFPDIC